MDSLPDHSDSSDEDYVPNANEENNVSEVESDGDPEDEFTANDEKQIKSGKRTKSGVMFRKKQKIGSKGELPADNASIQLAEEEKKKNEEDVWADFMRDTGFQSRKDKSVKTLGNTKSLAVSSSSSENKPNPEEKKNEKVKITQVFKFAGEEVIVEKEVTKDPLKCSFPETTRNYKSRNKSNSTGINNIINQLGKKPKINTLEKSKLDWDRFKKEENIEEELHTYNKGKDGYLEKQDFLQRADLRRFEIEKEIRTTERNKRMNN